MMILSELYADSVEKLKEASVPNGEWDAKQLILHFCDVSGNDFFVHGDKEIDDNSIFRLGEALKRRINREPLQYIIGTVGFMGLDFTVDKRVLIPRADTEILVEEALKYLHDGSRILDLCTGSGCILISLLHYSNDCVGVGTDLSADALSVSEINRQTIIPTKECSFLQGDLFQALSEEQRFEMIVSNPPYIPTEVVNTLMSEVKDYEPMMALDGSEDGLEFYRRIVSGADKYLLGGGALLFEIGFDQGADVKKLMEEAGYIEVEVIKDYAGLDRVVRGTKRCNYV